MESGGVTWGVTQGAQVGTQLNGTPENGTFENSTGEVVETASRLLPEWVPQWSVRLGLAIAVLVVAWYGSNLLVRLLGRRVARRFRRPSVSRAVLRSVRAGVMLFAVFVVAALARVSLGNILLSVTVLTAAVAVVVAPILGSIISGLFVLTDQSYEIGDMVRIVDAADDTTGFIEDITLRYTKIFTLDNTFLVIPNGTIRDRDVINYSAEDPRTRLSLDILVTYEGDLAQARELIERAARDIDTVIGGGPAIRIGSARYPAAPTCYINEYAENGVLLTLRYWVREPYKLLTVRSAVQENIWERLDGTDVEFAYPHTTVVFDDRDGSSTPGDGVRSDDRGR